MDEGTKRLADVIIESLKFGVAVIAGFWVYFRFRKESTHSPRVAFDIEATFVEASGDHCLAEFLLVMKNGGLVKHSLSKIELRVRGISRNEPIGLWGDTQRVEFPHRIVDSADVLYQRKYRSVFVEPGVTQKLTFVARIPTGMSFVLARAQFEYSHGRTHSTERVFAIPPKQVMEP